MSDARLVLVRWVDSYGCSARWEDIDENFDAPEIVECESVGWLIYEDKNSLVVVPHIVEATKRTKRQGCGDMTIPRCAVKSIVDLEEKR